MLYEFEQDCNAADATKNFRYQKDEVAVDYRTVTRWLKKFRSGSKNFDDQARSCRSKTVYSETRAMEANLGSSTLRVWKFLLYVLPVWLVSTAKLNAFTRKLCLKININSVM